MHGGEDRKLTPESVSEEFNDSSESDSSEKKPVPKPPSERRERKKGKLFTLKNKVYSGNNFGRLGYYDTSEYVNQNFGPKGNMPKSIELFKKALTAHVAHGVSKSAIHAKDGCTDGICNIPPV